MPQRVADFFRLSTSSLENSVTSLKKSTIRSRTKSPNRTAITNGASRSSERVASTYASSIDEDMEETTSAAHNSQQHASAPAVGRIPVADSPRLRPKDGHEHDKKEKEREKEKDHYHHHRLSFPGLHLGRSKSETHSNPHAGLTWKIESPPIIFHGDTENSTGALVSGQLFLDIKEKWYEIDSFKATLHIHVTQKKPFTVHCTDCINHYTLLKEWTFLPQPLALRQGVHPFPFSVLLDGHLPATLDNPVVSIAYEFKAEAIPTHRVGTSAQSVKLEKLFDVKRALSPPDLPHHSVRVFPPTNVKASVHYPQVIHPIGSNNLSMHLDGIAKVNPATNTVEYWKLKKLTWRLEETLKTVAPACDKHVPKTEGQEAAQAIKKGTARTETRVIGEKTLFSGWKSAYAGPTDSSVDLELEYALNKHAKFSCDLNTQDGTEVSHQLMLEMVVSQECAPVGKPSMVTQTGVGRILRMHFSTILTERGGIGISWDNEAPPIYQDVPPSPPAYFEDMMDGAVTNIESIPEMTDGLAGYSGSGHASGNTSGRSSAEGHR